MVCTGDTVRLAVGTGSGFIICRVKTESVFGDARNSSAGVKRKEESSFL